MKLRKLFQVLCAEASIAALFVTAYRSAQRNQTVLTRALLKGISIQEPSTAHKPVALSIQAGKGKAPLDKTEHRSLQSYPDLEPRRTDIGARTSVPSIGEKSVSLSTDFTHSSDPQTAHQENHETL